MASDLIQSTYRRIWRSLVIRGTFGIALGVLIIWRPMDSIGAFALVIAIYALFTGIVQIVHSFELRAAVGQWWVMLLGGLVGVAFGIAALYFYPGLSLTFAVVWAAWWLFVTGGIAIYAAVQERQLEMSWGWTLAFGILSIAVGVLCFANPPTTLASIMGLIAGFAIVGGVTLLFAAYKLSSVKADVTSRIRASTAQ
jgi:uncharacterized membrane protein HdeD (DUF308 family)